MQLEAAYRDLPSRLTPIQVSQERTEHRSIHPAGKLSSKAIVSGNCRCNANNKSACRLQVKGGCIPENMLRGRLSYSDTCKAVMTMDKP